MNYQKHYDNLVNRAKNRTLTGYSERHHIVPKCMGGTNDPENIVRLTASEHFVAHKLLIRMYPDNQKLWWAAIAMTNGTKSQQRNNKSYGWLKKEFSERLAAANKARVITEETRAKHRARKPAMLGRPVSADTRAKLSAALKGKPKSPDHIANSVKARTGIKYPPRTEEHKRNAREGILRAMKNVDRSWMQSPEYKAAQSQKVKEIWAARKAEKLKQQGTLLI